jgi:hypothetical protein
MSPCGFYAHDVQETVATNKGFDRLAVSVSMFRQKIVTVPMNIGID